MIHSISKNLLQQKQGSILLRYLSTKKSTRKLSNASTRSVNTPGLSEKCLKVPNAAVGPGAAKDKEYKNPEYFCYHVDSFGEAEVELEKYRLPSPTNKVPFKN